MHLISVVWHCTISHHSTHIPTLFVLFKDNGSHAGKDSTDDESIPKRACVLGCVYLKGLLMVFHCLMVNVVISADKGQ